MNYLDARKQIKSGHLLAWSHKAWASLYDFQVQMVRVFTQSEYCHVGVSYVIADRTFVIEAVGTGVRMYPASNLLPFYWFPLATNWNETAEKFALSQVGKPYSKNQAVLAQLDMLDKGTDGLWQCAELTQQILALCGVDLTKCKSTPSAVVEEAQKLGAPCHLVQPTVN